MQDKYEPDIFLLDIAMNKKDGIQVGTKIKRQHQNVIAIYTTNLNEKMSLAINRVHAFIYGNWGYIAFTPCRLLMVKCR